MYAERLKELRLIKGYTQTQAATIVNVSAPSYAAYESGKSKPTIDALVDFARHYGVSIDWLCGLSDNQNLNSKPSSYSDIISMLVKLEDTVSFDIISTIIGDELHDVICFSDSVTNHFLEDWKPLLTLKRNHTIDKKLHDLWIEDKLKEYSVSFDADEVFAFLLLKGSGLGDPYET